MLRISIEAAKEKLGDLTKAVKEGETVVLVINDEEFEITQHKPRRKLFGSAAHLFDISDDFDEPRKPGSAVGMISMDDDFDELLEDFKAYM